MPRSLLDAGTVMVSPGLNGLQSFDVDARFSECGFELSDGLNIDDVLDLVVC